MKIIMNSTEYAQLDLVFKFSSEVKRYKSMELVQCSEGDNYILTIQPSFICKIVEPMLKIKHMAEVMFKEGFEKLDKVFNDDEKKVRVISNGKYDS